MFNILVNIIRMLLSLTRFFLNIDIINIQSYLLNSIRDNMIEDLFTERMLK